MSTRRQQLQDDIARVAESLLRAFGGAIGRATVALWLMLITLLVILALSETLTDAEAAEVMGVLTLSVGGYEMTVFGVCVALTWLWVLSPIILNAVELYQEADES
jgi:hypothetical protein